jgi:mannose-6-phosphate isomerase-like protein (cupin superfamily)
MPVISRSVRDCPCFRIKAADTNYFVLLADPATDGITWVTVVEIFEPGGATPPNAHVHAWEQFVVLAGEGRAICDGRSSTLSRGDILIVPPGLEHVVENSGSDKLYCLTTMMPDEAFAAMIRNGIPETLTDDDCRVLEGSLGATR